MILHENRLPATKYYNVGSRKGQRLQARLRLECSSLNLDLYWKHIVPSPSCQCGEFEIAAHFPFNCPIYTKERQTYLPNILRTFTTKDLLFGCENTSEQDSQSLFLKKFKILLLILEDFTSSAKHNYTYVMVPNGRSSVTS